MLVYLDLQPQHIAFDPMKPELAVQPVLVHLERLVQVQVVLILLQHQQRLLAEPLIR